MQQQTKNTILFVVLMVLCLGIWYALHTWVFPPPPPPPPETLVPDDPENPSNLLLAFDVNNKDDDKPFDTLGHVDWTLNGDVVSETRPDGRIRQSVSYTSPPVQGFQVTKTFSLTERE